MRKTIKINGLECEFKSSAAIPRMYRLRFNRDIFVDINHIANQVKQQEKKKEEARLKAKEEGTDINELEFESALPFDSLEMFENIAYLMHKHGDPAQPKDIDEWLEQFETFDIYEILPQLLEMWETENHQMSDAKKKTGK